MDNKLYKLMNWPAIEEVIYSEADDPHALLGPHPAGTATLMQAYFPGSSSVSVRFTDRSQGTVSMERADDSGFYAALVPGRGKRQYRYIVSYEDGSTVERGDPYRHAPLIAQSDEDAFAEGVHYTVYELLGAHPMTMDDEEGTYFAVWAPNAMRVSVVGDFCGWDGRQYQMRRLPTGIFELFIPGVAEGDKYKYEIKLRGGLTYLKADPYGSAAELRPGTASVVASLSYKWTDRSWLNNRAKRQAVGEPISVYEMYPGSFAGSGEGGEYVNWRELAPLVIAYVKKMGYTHVELLPVMEHPLDESWGYQVIGYYAPTARYGSPVDFMYFINELHRAGIGVILDWVPAHFPRDEYGLAHFDGTALYEHYDSRQNSHPDWGTLIYNYGRPEVRNYLIANALYWVEVFHADGIRMDAVASMLYLDYGKRDGEWVANMYGGKENLEAIEFIRHLNSILHKRDPGVLSIAEESTAWPMVTGDPAEGGLGFDLKWNMGWMNDFIGFMRYDPFFRSKHWGELTFSMLYAYSERFVLVFSHDEVVHGKGTLIAKMPGDREHQFANLKIAYTYMMTHPGAKTLFMGQDLAEYDEWNEKRQVEWDLLEYPEHAGVNALVAELNKLYRSRPALHELDDSPAGFEWLNCTSPDRSFVTFLRKSHVRSEAMLVAVNFSGAALDLRVGVPYAGSYKEVLNTDEERFGGTGLTNPGTTRAADDDYDGRAYAFDIKLAPLSAAIFEYIPLG